MTGYAVTFKKHHKRSGHLFQNRYKSVVCEEDPYLLELIRYIHLNPIRSGLVNDLKELEKYPWTGHSTIVGKKKNPLIPDKPNKHKKASKPEKTLAERTVEDILLYFGDTVKVSRRRYRQFIKNGVDQGKRPELQGGGLVRSAGGNRAGLLGRKKDARDPPASPERTQTRDGGLGKGDERILGSGDFVVEILNKSNEHQRNGSVIPIKELANRVVGYFSIKIEDIVTKGQKRKISEARSVICYFAIKELEYSGVSVGKFLKIRRFSALRSAERGKKILDTDKRLWDLLAT